MPLVNIGSYFIVIENALIGLGLILLAFVPPRIVATMDAIPAWSKIVMGCLGIAVLLWQILGFIAISAEKTSLYRTYIRINFALTLATIAAAVAFIVASAVQHTQTVRSCVSNFGSVSTGGSAIAVSSSTNEVQQISEDICNIFIWVQVGLMALVTVLAGLTQVSHSTKGLCSDLI